MIRYTDKKTQLGAHAKKTQGKSFYLKTWIVAIIWIEAKLCENEDYFLHLIVKIV